MTKVTFISILHNTQHHFTDLSWCFRKVILAVLSADPLAASLVSPATVILCFQWALVFTGQMYTHTNALQHEDLSQLVC
jgi:hypothetical protein